MYECKGTKEECKNFEESRKLSLKSKDDARVRAAEAYGKPDEENGVTVRWGDPGEGKDGITAHELRIDPNDPNKFRALETVTLRSGLSDSAFDAAVNHEGSHVADAQDFLATANMRGESDASKNLTTYQTELKAYMVTQSVLSAGNTKRAYGDCGLSGPCVLGAGITPTQAVETINQLLANPRNRYGAAPNYGVTPTRPGPVLHPLFLIPK